MLWKCDPHVYREHENSVAVGPSLVRLLARLNLKFRRSKKNFFRYAVRESGLLFPSGDEYFYHHISTSVYYIDCAFVFLLQLYYGKAWWKEFLPQQQEGHHANFWPSVPDKPYC
jgi:hypothetical protein